MMKPEGLSLMRCCGKLLSCTLELDGRKLYADWACPECNTRAALIVPARIESRLAVIVSPPTFPDESRVFELVLREPGGGWDNDGYGEAVVSDSEDEILAAAESLWALGDDYANTEFGCRDLRDDTVTPILNDDGEGVLKW